MLVIDSTTPGTAPKPSIFLHGVTGAGKSTWATKGGRPLAILTEPKAMSILRLTNPDAVGLVPESVKDVLDLFQILGDPDRLAKRNIDRIVLDSFTDLTYSLPQWMKDPSGHQVLLKMEIQEFGDLKNYALALVKAIQLTGYPSIIIARSTVKKVGRVEKIVPDGYGRSVEELPGKCLPTVEARFDTELGYLIDSTPDECSQRCGLPWVPQVFKGTALEFLGVVGAPPTFTVTVRDQDSGKSTVHTFATSGEAETFRAKNHKPDQLLTATLDGAKAAGLAAPAETIGDVAANVTQAVKDAPAAVSAATDAFVDGMDSKFISREEWEDLSQRLVDLKVDHAQLKSYCIKKEWISPNAQGFNVLLATGWEILKKHLTAEKVTAFKAHLHQHHAAPKAA